MVQRLGDGSPQNLYVPDGVSEIDTNLTANGDAT